MVTDFDPYDALTTTCPGCGHAVAEVPERDLPAALVNAGRQWRGYLETVLDHPDGDKSLRVRSASRWSGIDYACHVRDVLSIFSRRVELTLLADEPEFGWWDHEAEADTERYRDQHPAAVGDDISHAAFELADLLAPLSAEILTRGGTRLGRRLTITDLGRFALHETLHHLDDARSVVPLPQL